MAFTGVGLANKEGVDPRGFRGHRLDGQDFASITGTAVVTNRGINRSVKIDTSKVHQLAVRSDDGFGHELDERRVDVRCPKSRSASGARWEVRQTCRQAASPCSEDRVRADRVRRQER
jgi:hypothetical protein